MRIGSPKVFAFNRGLALVGGVQRAPILEPVARYFSADAAFLAVDESGTGTFRASDDSSGRKRTRGEDDFKHA